MSRSPLSENAFVAPSGRNAPAVRALDESVVDRVLAELATTADRAPLPTDPSCPPTSIPADGRGEAWLLDALDTVVEEAMNPAHPDYIGHMETQPTAVSMVADPIVATVNNMLHLAVAGVLSTGIAAPRVDRLDRALIEATARHIVKDLVDADIVTPVPRTECWSTSRPAR